jgi:hypothetical protein
MKLFGARRTTVNVAISANTTQANMRTLAGSPAFECDVVVTIASGVIVSAGVNGAGVYALQTGTGWVAGTTLKLINNGFIEGFGGNANAGAGGDAIKLDHPLVIDNTNGYILGGGGGGAFGLDSPFLGGGGGGGGGQGNPGGGGAAGSFGGGTPGAAGTSGSRVGPGSGGAGGYASAYGTYGGDGGGGGGWGAAGNPSGYNNATQRNTTVGAGGYAIRTFGNGISLIGGYNASQVQGLIA